MELIPWILSLEFDLQQMQFDEKSNFVKLLTSSYIFKSIWTSQNIWFYSIDTFRLAGFFSCSSLVHTEIIFLLVAKAMFNAYRHHSDINHDYTKVSVSEYEGLSGFKDCTYNLCMNMYKM